jgi:peroxiredoxin
VLSDVGANVEREYGLLYSLDETVRPLYKEWGIDIPKSNGNSSYELPVPATYLIDKSGVVQYAFLDLDYTRRMEPSDIIERLKKM